MDTPTKPTPKAKLTATKVQNLKVPGKHSDGTVGGLYLHVIERATGIAKHWRLKFRIDGVESVASLGSYPEMSLEEAREAAREARKHVRLGESPVKAKKAHSEVRKAAAANTFELIAERWLESKGKGKKALVQDTLDGYRSMLAHAYRAIGSKAVGDIKLTDIANLEESIKAPSMAPKVRDRIRDVLGYAMRLGLIDRNVAEGRRVVSYSTTPQPAIKDEAPLKVYLERLGAFRSRYYGVHQALELLVLLPVRPVELVSMRWADLDLDAGLWCYVVSKTKRRNPDLTPHTVALPEQAVAILREMKLDQKSTEWVFPSPRLESTTHRGRDSLLGAMVENLGYKRGEISAHGFRSTFRTLAEEHLDGDPIVMELMLSHVMPGAMGATYARASLIPKRKVLAQKWADYVDGLRVKAQPE